MNIRYHAAADARGRPISLLVTAGPVSGDGGAAALPRSFPKEDWMAEDRVYDADGFGNTLKDKGIMARIPGRRSRKRAVRYDKRRNRIEIMFARPKDWRRVATRYGRCPIVFLSAIAPSQRPPFSGFKRC